MVDLIHEADQRVAIEVAVPTHVAAFLRVIPSIAQVHGIDVDPSGIPFVSRLRFLWNIINYASRTLRDKDYDICLLPRWGKDPYLASYLAYLTNAPVRCGQDPREELTVKDDYPGTEELMTIAVRGGHGLPDAVRQLRLLPAVGLIHSLDEQSAAFRPTMALCHIAQSVDIKTLCDRLNINAELRYAVIAPGASHSRRLWPLEKYAETINICSSKYSVNFLIVGSPGEKELGEGIEHLTNTRALSIIGKTSLEETIALLSHASFFVGNDSGPAHIAAGLGIPSTIVSVHAKSITEESQSSPSRVRPVGPQFVIVQPDFPAPPCTSTCEHTTAHCILGVSVQAVILETDLLISSSSNILKAQPLHL
jgi:ADP-heptose:LPS heptosyltransferase